MDVFLSAKTEKIGRELKVDLVICDRDYNILFNDRFTHGKWVKPRPKPGPWLLDPVWKPSPDFKKQAKKLTSLLMENKVIVFGEGYYGLYDILREVENLYCGIDDDTFTLALVKSANYIRKAFDFYEPRLAGIRFYYFSLQKAVELSCEENENENLKVQKPVTSEIDTDSALYNCLSTAFVYNVVEEATKLKAA